MIKTLKSVHHPFEKSSPFSTHLGPAEYEYMHVMRFADSIGGDEVAFIKHGVMRVGIEHLDHRCAKRGGLIYLVLWIDLSRIFILFSYYSIPYRYMIHKVHCVNETQSEADQMCHFLACFSMHKNDLKSLEFIASFTWLPVLGKFRIPFLYPMFPGPRLILVLARVILSLKIPYFVPQFLKIGHNA